MTTKVTSLGHVGIAVRDLDKMVDFYTRILGLTVTDGRNGGVFLSADPAREQHEFVMGVDPERRSNAQQISFTAGSLDDLKELYKAIVDYGCEIVRVINHGIAFGCYFKDPEENIVEVYWSTGMDYPQPHGDPIDLSKSNEELLQILADMPPKPGYGPHYYGEDAGKRLPWEAPAG